LEDFGDQVRVRIVAELVLSELNDLCLEGTHISLRNA
jgi:hypothetical protein